MDNQGAIKTALATGPTKRSKFIDIQHHYLRDSIAEGIVAPH